MQMIRFVTCFFVIAHLGAQWNCITRQETWQLIICFFTKMVLRSRRGLHLNVYWGASDRMKSKKQRISLKGWTEGMTVPSNSFWRLMLFTLPRRRKTERILTGLINFQSNGKKNMHRIECFFLPNRKNMMGRIDWFSAESEGGTVYLHNRGRGAPTLSNTFWAPDWPKVPFYFSGHLLCGNAYS